MLKPRYSSWRIAKRWRKARKNKKKNSNNNNNDDNNPAKEDADDNHTTSTPRTSGVSNASSGVWTDCGSYGDAVSLSGSVGSGDSNSNNNNIRADTAANGTTFKTKKRQQREKQQRQNVENEFAAFVDRVTSSDKMKTKTKPKSPVRMEADSSKPMPKITEEFDLSFGKEKNDSSSSSSSESDSDEYEDIIETDDECTDDECDDEIDESEKCGENGYRFSADHFILPAHPLPHSRELSKVLCRIVFGMGGKPHGRNRRRAMTALSKVMGWVEVADHAFLRDFLTYGGMPKILDFLQDLVMESNGEEESSDESDSSDSDDDRRRQLQHGGAELMKLRITIEGIRNTARVISGVCKMESRKEGRASGAQERINKSRSTRNSPGYAFSNNENLPEMMAKGVVNHGGIETLLRASHMCCQFYSRYLMYRTENRSASATFDGEAVSLVEAAEEVWTAIANTCTSSNDETGTKIVDGVSVSVWDAGLVAMETFSEGIGLGSCFGDDRDSGHTCMAVAAAATPPAIAVLLLNTSVFRAFETILVRRRGDPLVTRNLFAEQKVLSRAVKLVPSPKKIDGPPDVALTINNSSRSTASLHSSLHSQINWSVHSGNSLHSSIHSCSIHSIKKSDSTFSEEEEAFLLEEALSFFHECHTQELLFRRSTRRKIKRSNESDEWWFPCEGMMPLCIAGLQKFGLENTGIRRKAVRILDAALDNCSGGGGDDGVDAEEKNSDREQMLLAELIEGVIEALARCLVSDRVHESEKEKFRALIRKIAGMDKNKKEG